MQALSCQKVTLCIVRVWPHLACMALLMKSGLMQATSGAAPRRRGWFGRKNQAGTPAATNEPPAPGTPAAHAGASGTAPTTGTPVAGPNATTGVSCQSTHDLPTLCLHIYRIPSHTCACPASLPDGRTWFRLAARRSVVVSA